MKMPLRALLPIIAFLLYLLPAKGGEVILQYFNTSWNEISRRMPELAEAGYTALWLPPPSKASGTLSVGFDNFNRFDFGETDERFYNPAFYDGQENWWPENGKRTKYGTRHELQRLMKTAHRFGIKVYFDNIMAHNSGGLGSLADNPPGQPLQWIPWHSPEDFHVGVRDGDWDKFADWPDWNDEWQVLTRNPFSWDIANESRNDTWEGGIDGMNTSFDPAGLAEGSDYPKWSGIRHPDRHEFYIDTDIPVATDNDGNDVFTFANKEPFDDYGLDGIPNTGDTGEGDSRFTWDDANANDQHDVGEASEPFADTGLFPTDPVRTEGVGDNIYNMGNIVSEDVNAFLMRSMAWTVDFIKADGFRLDAVKHVPDYFFGKQDDPKDASNWGYIGTAQVQHNVTRGFSDWNNHRDTTFGGMQFQSVDDLMMFGEHLGEPPGFGGYASAGMRIGTDSLLNAVGNGGMGGSYEGKDAPGWGNLWGSTDATVSYIMSHDNNYLSDGDRKAAYAYLLLRQGLPILYTDGYNQSTEADNWFPKQAHTPYLGQFSDYMDIMDTLKVNKDQVRGYQEGLWSDGDFMAWEMKDFREQGDIPNWSGSVAVVMMARNWIGGWHSRSFWTGFPVGARLKCYGPNGGWYANVSDNGVILNDEGDNPAVPSNSYYVFAWRTPELPFADHTTVDNWDGHAIEIYEGTTPVSWMLQRRTDGIDGDANFNPYQHVRNSYLNEQTRDEATDDRTYEIYVPRITDGSNLRFVATADGSAANILLKLDGGIDINGTGNDSANRDYPPGLNNDLNPDAVGTQSSTNTYEGYEQMSYISRYTLATGDPAVEEESIFPFQAADITNIEGMMTQFEISGFDATSIAYHPHNDHGEWATGLEEGYHVLRSRSFVGRTDGSSIFRTNTQTFYYDTKRPEGIIRWPANDNDGVSGEYNAVVLTDDQATEVWYEIIDLNGTHTWTQAERVEVPTNTNGTEWTQEWAFVYTNIPDNVGIANITVKILEESSSSDLTQTDEAGWYTTLNRQLNTGGGFNMNIGTPIEGEVVNDTWVMKVWFKAEMYPAGTPSAVLDQQLIDEFTITIASTTSGSNVNPVTQDLSSASIERGDGWENYALNFTFPQNLYNGNPDFLHYVDVTHTRSGLVQSDSVLVKMEPIDCYDGDGDGLPAEWELANNLNDASIHGDFGTLGDPDQDGVSNMEEYILKVDPKVNDLGVHPGICGISVNPDGSVKINFDILGDRKHLIQYSDDLSIWNDAGDWVNDGIDIAYDAWAGWDDDGWLTGAHPNDATRRFYRIMYGLQNKE